MSETMKKVINVQFDQEQFSSNIANMPKNTIVDTNPNVYKMASMQFVKMATGKITPEVFKGEYPQLDIPVNMLKTVVEQTHLPGGISTNGKSPSGQEATEFVHASVIENLAEEIAEANYPIIDRVKSANMARTFAETKTPEQRIDAIDQYNQLDQVFQFSDAMSKITKKDATQYVSQLLESGKAPEMTDDLRNAVKTIDQQQNNEKQEEMTR